MDRPDKHQLTFSRWVLSGSALTLVVVGSWLLLGGVIVSLMPGQADAAPTPSSRFVVLPGQAARIRQPGVPSRPVLASHAGLDRFQHTMRVSDEQPIEDAFAVADLIAIGDGQAVRIVAVDGTTVQVELLDGAYAGHLTWLDVQDLDPSQ